MKMKKVMALGMTAALWIFSGCGGFSVRGTGEESAADGEDAQTGDGFRENGDGREAEDPQTADDSATKEDQTDSTASEAQTDEEMFTDRDYETDYDGENCVSIRLNGSQAEASSDSVRISGSTVTITEEAVYVISGTLDDGMILVDASDADKIQLVLQGAEINSETSAPLYILEADKVFLTLAEGTENTLSNGGTFTAIDDSTIDAAIFSRQDLTMNGSGSLTVISPAGHGIVAKDDLAVTGGSYTVEAASHGLNANDSVRITGETSLNIRAGKDGIHVENEEDASLGFLYVSGGTLDIQAEGDGLSAGSYLQISDGDFRILARGGSENGASASSDSWGEFRGGRGPGQPEGEHESGADQETAEASTSMKRMKAVSWLLIIGGSFSVDSADDSIHSNGTITVENGDFQLASGDDAVHADDTLTVADGSICITESYEGLEALHIFIQGGEIVLTADDDGLNAAGGKDSSGTEGGRDAMFGNPPGAPGEKGGEQNLSSNGSIEISGGTLDITASGDGIDANGSVSISGGYTVVTGPTQGDTSTLDYDTTAVITGGTFIGTGASGMAQSFSDSQQGVVAVSLENQPAQTTITIADADGTVLLEYTPQMAYEVVIYSSPRLVSGQTYTVTAGAVSGETEAG